MERVTVKLLKVVRTEEFLRDTSVFFMNDWSSQFMLDPNELRDLPPGTYVVRGEVIRGAVGKAPYTVGIVHEFTITKD